MRPCSCLGPCITKHPFSPDSLVYLSPSILYLQRFFLHLEKLDLKAFSSHLSFERSLMQLLYTLWLLITCSHSSSSKRTCPGRGAAIDPCIDWRMLPSGVCVCKQCTKSSTETKMNACWKAVKFRLKSYSEGGQTRGGGVMEYEKGNWIKKFSLKQNIRQDDNVLVCQKWTGKKESWKSLNWTLCEPFWKNMLQHICTE